MKLLCAGGGSGGHVTPVLAVINEVAVRNPGVEVVFVCDKAFLSQAQGLMQHADVPVRVIAIPAGKLRRYHNESFLVRLLDVTTHAKNFADVFRIIAGFWKSWWLIGRFRPDVVFAKGGFVCLPVGYAAHMRHVPLVIHDSDIKPGLTNRLLAKYAAAIATGFPVENYPYDLTKTVHTGVPIAAEYHPVNAKEQRGLKGEIGVDPDKPLVVITGGGLGSMAINRAALHGAKKLLDRGAQVYHICGEKNYDSLRGLVPSSEYYQLVAFVYSDMWKVLAAADVVVSRASATFLQELAALKKPVIAVPGAQLADQQKNAALFDAAGALRVLQDVSLLREDANGLIAAILELIDTPETAQKLAEQLYAFAQPQAAQDVAEILVRYARSTSGNEERS